MSEHIINNNVGLNLSKSCMDDSPCLVCEYRNTEGGSCALLCLRLAAYNSGEPWEDKSFPYIIKQKTKEPKKEKNMKSAKVKNRNPNKSKPIKIPVIKLYMSKYPEIMDYISLEAEKFRLPQNHIFITLLSEAIANRKL